ncbi:MAG: 2-polyprenylphenol 6-hydroxylase [Bradyrhizobium sp.]|nr:MAG: 2-polyprenylphenol 6-hydroxylase [Bradyrhizobium sp.]
MTDLGHALRLTRACFTLAREGALIGIDPATLPPLARLPLALANILAKRGARGLDGLAAAFGRLGPSYVKLGQFLATRPDIVGFRVAGELEKLQDRVTPTERAAAVAAIEAAFGAPIATLYIEFGEPVAAASVAQVHRARVRDADGERDVAVKLLRPGVERRFARDLSDMLYAARSAERFEPRLRRLRLVEVVETLARGVRIEMDLRLEAAAASEFAETLANEPGFRAPRIDWNRTTREALTMEWIDGAPLSDPARLAELGFDPPALGRALIQSFLRHALRDGFFHADMHQGNFIVDADGRIVVIDFGIMGRIGRKERRFLAEILYGFIRRDYRRVAEVHFEAGYVSSIHRVEDFAQAIRAVGEPIHARTADQISMAKLLTLLFEVTALFDMKTRLELVMLQKTMVVVEGVARKLDPHLDMWATAEPVVAGWISENLGPRGRLEDLGHLAGEFARLIAAAPALLERLARRLDSEDSAGPAPAPTELPRQGLAIPLALWAIFAALVYLIYHLG